ncbi:uncharacterized protein LOC116843973 isoform X2 [Odontomachus brunneus]|uniref:uncharacterized protein LOC116843973 isoform X2 n=1 Tax=Odontomachus brunneus TaxID=486640 RepID=UPI0013F1A22F|nr:uncharacterized protein LOC116843973 isoform X2 [Odontomachus brunneus]
MPRRRMRTTIHYLFADLTKHTGKAVLKDAIQSERILSEDSKSAWEACTSLSLLLSIFFIGAKNSRCVFAPGLSYSSHREPAGAYRSSQDQAGYADANSMQFEGSRDCRCSTGVPVRAEQSRLEEVKGRTWPALNCDIFGTTRLKSRAGPDNSDGRNRKA